MPIYVSTEPAYICAQTDLGIELKACIKLDELCL